MRFAHHAALWGTADLFFAVWMKLQIHGGDYAVVLLRCGGAIMQSMLGFVGQNSEIAQGGIVYKAGTALTFTQ